jgi:hypothetical protein
MLAVLAVTLAATSPLGVFGHTLAHFDRDTLQPVGPRTQVIEPHAPGVLSPGGERMAMGISKNPPPGQRGRVGVWIVDPETMQPVHEVSTGIAAEQVAFPGVVAAVLQGGDLVIVDRATGAITARHRDAGDPGCGGRPASFPGGAAFALLGLRGRVRLVVVDARGAVRAVRLRVRYRIAANACGQVGLAVDRARRRAFVVTGDGRVAEVSLRDLRVRYHRTGVRGRRCARCVEGWRAAWVPGTGLAVAGSSSGLRVLDPRTWRTRWRDRSVRTLAVAGGTIVGAGAGVTAYAADGRRRFHALGGRAVGWFEVAAGRIYADDGRALSVLDVETGAVRARLAATQLSFWLLDA